MKILKISSLFLWVFFIGCAGNTDSNTDAGSEENIQIAAAKDNVNGNAKLAQDANPCDYFTADVLKKYLNTGDKKITLRKSSIGDEYSKNCIAIWKADGNVKEQMVDGYKDIAPGLSSKFKYSLGTQQEAGWATDKLNKLIKEGSAKTPEHNAQFVYSQVMDLGDKACWSKEKSHLVWQRGNDVFEIFINIPLSETNRKAYAMAIARDLNSQF